MWLESRTLCRLTILSLSAGCVAAIAGEVGKPPAPSVIAFDPGAMPEPATAPPALGWRFAALSPVETQALRRGFKLPLDALSAAQDKSGLLSAAVVAPLPDPTKPLLAVEATGPAKSNPFVSATTTSLRENPMRALGEMLAVAGQAETDATVTDEEDPFGTGDPLASSGVEAAAEIDTTAPAEAADDPFSSDDDPFGAGDGSDDPFGAF